MCVAQTMPCLQALQVAPHHLIASWAPRSPRPLDTNDHHNRTVVVLSYSNDTMTRNLRPTPIGADAACVANSRSSFEPSNYALATTKATGDLLPQALLAAPKAHVGETKSTVCESEPHRCCHVACMCCLNDLATGPVLGGLANAVKGNRTSHVFASCQHPMDNNNKASAGEATNCHDVC
jgi:hypothetical protein